jgi:demethylmenaquinone methyltransferase/2-methoxy-6-polyprenyl-1,4-benzoquinol methylase
MDKQSDHDQSDIYDPAFVADLFDRCSTNYRRWSAVSSFGFVWLWRRQCVGRLTPLPRAGGIAIDLMAGTGEIWPHLLRKFPDLETITALDISHRMHLEAVEKLHKGYADRITHLQANALEAELPEHSADIVVSTFGLKTFDPEQQTVLAGQIARMLKPGGQVSLIEASDPKGWILRPVYRAYLDWMLPRIERFFLKGANDFSMIGTYTRNFGSSEHIADALGKAGLSVMLQRHFFGCATSVTGFKPGA